MMSIALEGLIAESVRKLSIGYYTPAQREGRWVRRSESIPLIRDGTYFVADVGMVGCGGWSRRKTQFGSDSVGAAKNDDWFDPPAIRQGSALSLSIRDGRGASAAVSCSSVR